MKKYFSILFIIFFIIIFSLFNRDEFLNNFEDKTVIINEENSLKNNISQFKLENLKDIENTKFYYTPYKKLLDDIIYKINNANKRVYIEVYMLTEKRIQKALVDANNDWVEVRVILEKNPYKANNINNTSFKYLDESWIDIVWSNPDNYSLNHSKFMIIDDELIVSTWNLTYSTFAFNRDLFLFVNDKSILNKFLEIFNFDFSQNKKLVYHDNLIVSPDYSRDKFQILFKESKKSLDLYFQYLSDEKLEDLLVEKVKTWIKIRIIVSQDFYADEKVKIRKLEDLWISIKPLKTAKMHSKAILVDNKYLFIWSTNFSSYSIDKNREVGLIVTNRKVIEDFSKLYNKDFAN